MEVITNCPGLWNIAEEIFLMLDDKDLKQCKLVDESWKRIIDRPIFWLKRGIQTGKIEYFRADWTKTVQIVSSEETQFEET